MVRELNEFTSCDKCKQRSLKCIESRKVPMSASRRRRYECTNCGERCTRYEVNDDFYNQAIENQQIIQDLRKVIFNKGKSENVNKHVKDCTTCEYNGESKCAFDLPEFDTEEAEGCTYYEIKKWKTSPGLSQAA